MKWYRERAFTTAREGKEIWRLDAGDEVRSFEVNARYGKEINVRDVKRRHSFQSELDNTSKYRDYFESRGDFVAVEPIT